MLLTMHRHPAQEPLNLVMRRFIQVMMIPAPSKYKAYAMTRNIVAEFARLRGIEAQSLVYESLEECIVF